MQIKMTAGHSVAMYAECIRLVVLKVISSEEAEIVYDGPGAPAWSAAGKVGKNGQRVVRLSRLRALPSIPKLVRASLKNGDTCVPSNVVRSLLDLGAGYQS